MDYEIDGIYKVVVNEINENIHLALDSLSEMQRCVFTMTFFDGLKVAEIASLLGCMEETVRRRLKKALENMRVALKDFEEYAR